MAMTVTGINKEDMAMFSGFTQIEDAFVITWESGVFRQQDLFRRGNTLYVKQKGGYLRLADKGATSHPKVRWYEVHGQPWKVGAGEYLNVAP